MFLDLWFCIYFVDIQIIKFEGVDFLKFTTNYFKKILNLIEKKKIFIDDERLNIGIYLNYNDKNVPLSFTSST